ncbi:hypothetical protein B4110_0161 [Parageobacillus toebii]|uniref:Uncharacterized protein n=1 Tax=Parageobacillus toebii TaxID=153151 RepID=A0A150MPH1_9BACL|nr:hypothetical protein B4110_0161 [Parageobacillus toebii]
MLVTPGVMKNIFKPCFIVGTDKHINKKYIKSIDNKNLLW